MNGCRLTLAGHLTFSPVQDKKNQSNTNTNNHELLYPYPLSPVCPRLQPSLGRGIFQHTFSIRYLEIWNDGMYLYIYQNGSGL